jgi:polysaccharide deacetylase 2 family uncharacterized protein YibQ
LDDPGEFGQVAGLINEGKTKELRGKTGMRGFLVGVSIGTLVAVGGAAMWSLSTPLPPQVRVSVTEPDAAAAPEPSASAPVERPSGDADLVEAVPVAPSTAPADDVSGLAAADTVPAARPELVVPGAVASDGEAALPAKPGAPSELSTANSGGDPVTLPASTAGEDDIIVSTQPAPAPAETEIEVAQAPQEDPDQSAKPELTASQDDTEGARALVPSVAMPELGTAPAPTAPPVITFASPAPQAQPDPAEETPAEAETQGDETQVAEAEPAPGADATDRIAALPTANEPDRAEGPQIGTRVIPLTERDGVNEIEEEADTTEQSPFKAFAAPYEASEDRPLMSIVLIDDAESVGAEALAEFPYPLSFAIDPEDPRAAEKMVAYRAAGFEVLILADLPREARPQDAETAFEVWRERLPEAVALLEGVRTGVQGNRPLADQVSDVAQAGGYGLVLQNSGLNTVQKLALREGVPAGVVFRDFDGAGQNPRAMRRFLDQAAFRAGQEGAVIMLGRLQPDTISALLLWGLQDRASRVALAPVSASLAANLAETAE